MSLCLCLMGIGAGADGILPRMPAPPDVPVYWQLVSIDQEREVTPGAAYTVEDTLHGLVLDLDDGLMMESMLEADGDGQGLSLVIKTDDALAMEHTYLWTPLPIYLVPDTDYIIDVTGASVTDGASPNTLLGIYTQGDSVGRISAGGYTGHANQIQFTLNTSDLGIYQDGGFVVSIIVRDVNDMYRNRLVFTYEMHDGARPYPTPVPGFVATELPVDAKVPAYYVPVSGSDGVWQIVTAPEQYRAFGVMTGAGPYFFPSDAEGNVVMNETPADAQADFDAYVKGFVAEDTETFPPYYTRLSDGRFELTARDGTRVVRAFGRMDGGEPAFYPVGEDGLVAEDASPADPVQDFEDYVKGFGAAIPEATPAHYQAAEGGVYTFTGRDGTRYYRVYGRLDGAEAAFYPADEQGTLEGENPPAVDPESDFELYIKGFDPVAARNAPAFYTAVGDGLYVVVDREGNPVYRAYGIKDGAEPAYYPADENGALPENAQPVSPDDDYEAYIAGFEPMEPGQVPAYYEVTAVPGVWAFIDREDNAQYRAFGALDRGEPLFYPADVEGHVASDALPVQPASDLALMAQPEFTSATPLSVPAHYRVVSETESVYLLIDLEGEKIYRAYGSFGQAQPLFYPSDETGEVPLDAVPVDPEEDYAAYFGGFVTQQPQAGQVPAHYVVVGNVYRFTDLDGNRVYRVFGGKEGAETAFYPADEEGRLISGEPVNVDAEYEAYYDLFAIQIPETVPAYYEIVDAEKGLYRYTDLDGNESHRVYGGKEGGQAAFYPADAEGVPVLGEPVDTAKEQAEVFEAFVTIVPDDTAIPAHYNAVEGVEGLYTFEDKQGRPVFRVFGSAGAEGEAGAFYPADGEGNILSARVADPEDDAALLAVNTSHTVSTPLPAAEDGQTPVTRTQTLSTAMPASFIAVVSTTGPTLQSNSTVTRMITALPDAAATEMPATILAAITQQLPQATGTPVPISRIAEADAENVATPESTDQAADPTVMEPVETQAAPASEPTEEIIPQATEQSESEPQSQGISTGLLIALIALAVVAAGGILFVLLRKRKGRA